MVARTSESEEAKRRAMTNTTIELILVESISPKFEIKTTNPMNLYHDNQTAIYFPN